MMSADPSKTMKAVRLLSEEAAGAPLSPKVLNVLETALVQAKEGPVRATAANLMKNYATERQVPMFLSMLSDRWPPVRSAAIDALIKLKSPKAIGPVAACLNDIHSREDAARFLTAMGPAAEDAVHRPVEVQRRVDPKGRVRGSAGDRDEKVDPGPGKRRRRGQHDGPAGSVRSLVGHQGTGIPPLTERAKTAK